MISFKAIAFIFHKKDYVLKAKFHIGIGDFAVRYILLEDMVPTWLLQIF